MELFMPLLIGIVLIALGLARICSRDDEDQFRDLEKNLMIKHLDDVNPRKK